MATMTPLQQALKSLCSRTGWCYAVFWKLKRRSRMMLTWEDGHYDYSCSYHDACNDGGTRSGMGGNPLEQGGVGDSEGQIGLAVARMSYYVYSMGEGIIGRVAFTGKHQWVFHDGQNHLEIAAGGSLNNQAILDKNTDGWQSQFAAGIKTIAVIAVPQGVVQLGSTKMIMEDLKWIDNVKSVFSALQTASSSSRIELGSEGQGARSSFSNKMPLLSGSSTSVITRKTTTSQHRQSVPRIADDDVHWQKLGATMNPAVFSNFNRPHSVSGSGFASAAPHQRLQLQHAAKVLPEPQCTKNSSTGSELHNLQMQVNVCQVPSIPSNIIQSDDNITDNWIDDTGMQHLKKTSTWMSLVTEDMSSGLHDLKNDPVTPTCAGNLVEKLSAPKENYPFNKVHPMQSFSETGEDGFMNGPFKSDDQQQLNCSIGDGIALKCPNFPTTSGRLMVKGNKAYPIASSIDDGHANESRRSIPIKSESQCSERESFSHTYTEQNDINNLEELEKFLASFSKETGKWDKSFAIGDELSQALGPAFWKSSIDDQPNLSADKNNDELVINEAEKASVLPSVGSDVVTDSQYDTLTVICPPESKQEPLLDAVVRNTSSSQHSVSSNTDGAVNLSAKLPFSNLTSGMPVMSIIQDTEQSCSSSLSGKVLQTGVSHEIRYHDNVLPRNKQARQNFSISSDTHTNMSFHSWTDDGQSMRSDDVLCQSRKSEEIPKSSKKRSRSGESPRPRPKDRQQIQDRVRELREIVPNGSKCSIDALLEKTIKHMLFLHSVTLHANQLKNTGEIKEDSDSGATWALDLGSGEKRCPIVVKDLNQPRQMLVEMVCEESGLFLETADIIRNLGLTILKGSLESQGDKFWAKFIVEANCDIQRVDVLVSLIQRLHLDNYSSSSSMTMASQSTALKPQQVDSIDSHTFSGQR
ncbi:hypothetical protein KP509_24G018600 [Ceratopteris richardii]|uniref:BHLH domain-containing protein n=2 Tax=Ceratopteris richardii TaxID=49495 RepID=A0A8T2RSZ0_CERRI|nr:hypothetical protein KP509_24G018600 [Ceratopteris richardii]KAH7299572.1 hypothetical protein KP509_24G018600 [Ceratopteris richardii]KAH7299573.1 hypothetical protein KP509_24G018600 [Ceratopteris richardii]